jgi:rhamnogalacturonan endolyase
MLLGSYFASFLALAVPAYAAFGFTKSGNNYVIDAGSTEPLIFNVSSASCDINSIKYRGTELQYQSKGSHISSGLGTATVSATTINSQSIKKLYL